MNKVERVLLFGSALLVAGSGSGSKIDAHTNQKVVGSSGGTLPTENAPCSFNGDCKEPSAPYCNIIYRPQSQGGNYGECRSTKDNTIQVIDEENCPKGLVKTLIYQYEGTEAVCLTPTPPPPSLMPH